MDHLVHVATNVNQTTFKAYKDWRKIYYFVEFDVKYLGGDTIYRMSQFVRSTPNKEVCLMNDYIWKEDVHITLLTPIRNQVTWLQYLIEMLENVISETNEKNVSR